MHDKEDIEEYKAIYIKQYEDVRFFGCSRFGRLSLMEMMDGEVKNGCRTQGVPFAKLQALFDLFAGRPSKFGKK